MTFMRILISVIITDDGGVTMQRIGSETFAQGFFEGLSLVFLSSFDFLNIFVQKWCWFCIHAKRESGRGCVRPRRRVDRENDLGGEARLARVEKDGAIMQNMIFDSVFEVDSVLEKNKSDF